MNKKMKNNQFPTPKVDTNFVSHLKKAQRLRNLFSEVLPPLYDNKELHEFVEKKDRILKEDFFDSLMERIKEYPINEAFEPLLISFFHSSRCIIWISETNTDHFYSPTLNIYIDSEDSLVSASARSRIPINCASIEGIESLNQLKIERNSPQLFFPLFIINGPVIAVAQISREPLSPTFNDEDMSKANFLTRKYSLYGSPTSSLAEGIKLASELSEIMPEDKLIDHLQIILLNNFSCNIIEFWLYQQEINRFLKYDINSKSFLIQKRNQIGIVGYSLMTKTFVMERSSKYHSNYNSLIDGDPNFSILIGNFEIKNIVYGICLKDPKNGQPFNIKYKKLLLNLIPFISHSIGYSFNLIPQPNIENKLESNEIEELINFAPKVLQNLYFLPLIHLIESELSKIFNNRKVTLYFLYDDKIFFNFKETFSDHQETTISKCLIGKCFLSRKTEILNNIKSIEGFNLTVDANSIENIDSLLLCPIFNSSDEAISVISIINTINDNKLNLNDESRLSGFSVFCGISIQNALIYQNSLNLLSFISNLMKLNKIPCQEYLDLIFNTATKTFKAKSATIYTISNDSFIEYCNVGIPIDKGLDYALLIIEEKKTKVFRLPNTSERETPTILSPKLINNVSHPQSPPAQGIRHIESRHGPVLNSYFCCSPIYNQQDLLIGIFQFSFYSTGEDLFLIESFIEIASYFCNKTDLNISINNCWNHEFINQFQPFLLNNSKISISNIEFESSMLTSNELIHYVFQVFQFFNFFKIYNIEQKTLYIFLKKIEKLSKKIIHYNFNHLIGVLQFLIYQLILSKFHNVLSEDELFSLIIAAICHDVNHDGFIQINAGVSYELILPYSPTERKHFKTFENIINEIDSNIFINFEKEKLEKIKNLIYIFIISTDMSKHFSLLQDLTDSINDSNFSFENEKIRILTSQILLKAADFEKICRPFPIINKEGLVDEFFAEGNIWAISGIEFISEEKNRSNIHWGDSINTVLMKVIYPTFNTLPKALPDLQINSKIVGENIEKIIK